MNFSRDRRNTTTNHGWAGVMNIAVICNTFSCPHLDYVGFVNLSKHYCYFVMNNLEDNTFVWKRKPCKTAVKDHKRFIKKDNYTEM